MSARPDPTAAASGAVNSSDDPHLDAVVARMSVVDRMLPLWIGLAMVAGLLLGRLIPG
jgi:ACR3 family arsenite transporter